MVSRLYPFSLEKNVAVNAKGIGEDIVSMNTALTTAAALENQCTASEDCVVVAAGSRVCGNPNSYVVYSIKSSNAEDIHSLTKLITRVEQQYNMENSVMSICSLVMAPRAVYDETKKYVAEPTSSSFDEVALEWN